MPRTDFIDLSHHNTVGDLALTAQAGIIGVIHKATEGTGYVDDKMIQRRTMTKAAGMKWATYHFFKHGNVSQQMDHYLNVVQPVMGERVVIDHEADATLDELIDAVLYLQNNRPDLEITIYSGHTIRDQIGDADIPELEKTSLWVPRYSTQEPEWPKNTWPAYTAWQFSQTGSVAGIEGAVDLNFFNGSRENCEKWFGPSDGRIPVPKPEPTPERQIVTVEIDAPDGVEVVVNVNGG